MDALSLNEQWKDCLDLSHRKAPELYETNDEVRNTPYALAIRTTLEELGVSAVFCVEKVPTAVICILEKYDHDGIVELHAKLWNQGLAILLLVLTEDDNTVRVFSLARIPPQSIGESAFDKRCLVQKLEVVADALELKNIIYGVQSGRLWKEHDKLFKFEERIDQILLDNLSAAHKQLCDVDLPKDEAKTLLIQTMFIAYLEDRGIIGKEYFRKASDAKFNNFISLLESKCIFSFEKLFKSLKKDFNGDLFVAPCSFEIDHTSSELRSDYLEILADFRSGELNMSSGQYRFWGYDFKYIPIDLISAVYDRFLGENEKSRKEQGAYYTPMFLANIVISQVWDTHGVQAFDSRSRFLDPACGSGIFLVQCFHRLCEDWIQKHTPTIDWNNLVAILQRLCGWDLNGDAVRVAVFSLYVAFLEYVSSQDIQKFAQKGRSLPGLWSQTLCVKDYFDVPPENFQVDVIVGNPPWVSRKGANHSSVKWCEDQNLPIPDKQSAWGFVWKSLIHLSGKGIVAFLVPSMGFLHNTSNTSVDARQKLTKHAHITRIIDFSDLRLQLFDSAKAPAALVIFSKNHTQDADYRFDYWAPKSDINLKTNRLITLSQSDRNVIASHMVQDNPMVFKNCFWMNGPQGKLLNYIKLFPGISDLIGVYSNMRNASSQNDNQWLIGQGFRPAKKNQMDNDTYRYQQYEVIARIPHLPVRKFRTLAQNFDDLPPWENSNIDSTGFQKGYDGPRILIPRSITATQYRLRASYAQNPGSFQESIVVISVPKGEERRAKLLTALLNSKLFLWFAFHDTASFGIERPKVLQSELLRLPFPSPKDLPECKRSESAGNKLVQIVEREIQNANDTFSILSSAENPELFKKIDRLAYDYFCLSDEEIILVEDTVKYIIPAVHPPKKSYPIIWETSNDDDRKAYADVLIRSLKEWFDESCSINIMLEAHSKDLAILRLSLEEDCREESYYEKNDHQISDVLGELSKHINHPLPGNFQLKPDFRLFHDNNLYLVKPIQKRFWLRSTAIADADSIALDLQKFSGSSTNWSNT